MERKILLLLMMLQCYIFADSNLNYIALNKTKYGNDSQFNPISYYFNAAFDTIQNPYYFSQKDYLSNHELVFKRVRSPINNIKKDGGFKKFFTDEFITSRSAPNYSLHLIGGGYDYRKLVEWFDDHQYELPYVWAFLTSYAAEFGNEALESSNKEHINSHDHIADLLFFDLVGKAIFFNDTLSKFFVDDMGLRTWSFQPTYDFSEKRVFNAGNNYIVRPKLFGEQIRPFVFFGMQLLTGVSMKIKESDDSISFGAGPAYTDPLDGKAQLASGFFWDRSGNLLASLLLNSTSRNRVRLNLYPLMYRKNTLPGIFMAYDRDDNFRLGLNYIIPVGITDLL